jgi:hypothetical protein
MNRRALAAVTLFAAIGIVFAWRTGSSPDPGPQASGGAAPPPPSVALAPPPAPPNPRLSRNPFEYAEPRAIPVRPTALFKGPLSSPSSANASTAPVKLVGFVHRRGALGVILSIRGEVLLLTVGEQGGGYTLVAADEEKGARLTGPDGSAVDLAYPASSAN